jgi:hypothetical protein
MNQSDSLQLVDAAGSAVDWGMTFGVWRLAITDSGDSQVYLSSPLVY